MGKSRSRSRSFAIPARRTTTGPVETHRGGRKLKLWKVNLSLAVSQSVSYFSYFTVPPRAHPSTGSQSGSAAPVRPHEYRVTEYSLPGATQLAQVRSFSPSEQGVPCRFLPCTVSQSVTSQSVNQSVISQFSRCNVPIRLVKIENSIIQKCLHADALNSFSGDAGRHRPCDNMICRYYMIMNM